MESKMQLSLVGPSGPESVGPFVTRSTGGHDATAEKKIRRDLFSSRAVRVNSLAFVVGALVVVTAGAPLSAENWPQWRGPLATGVSAETGLPQTWSNTENVAWKARLGGLGVSSPIVWGDRVFVTSQAGEGERRMGPRLGQGADASSAERSLGDEAGGEAAARSEIRFMVEALDRGDGRKLWTHEVIAEGAMPAVHDKHNLASASPVTDGERVYAVFGTGQVVAVDVSGRPVWTRHLGKEFGPWEIIWGNGSSPIVHGGALIVVSYHEPASYLIALDVRTGHQLWKTDRPRGVLSYSTPIVVPVPTGDELVVNSTVGIEGYDVATGRALWHFDEANQFPIPVAMYHDGVIYLSRGYRSGPFAAIRPGGRGDIAKTHVIWHVSTGAPYISSLVYYNGLLFMAGDVGVITCVDAKTGERVWRERLGGLYTASPIAAAGRIYLFSESGETIVLRAGRTPEVIARNQLEGRILASPAVANGRIFIRTDDHVVAIGGGKGS
jgi:outer membrane protein assembly factor BamB